MSTAIVVHGGAGAWPAAMQGRALAGCRRAAAAGWALLCAGAHALDAVEAAVRVLEDDPHFNAGRGAALNQAGEVELDAALMGGAPLRAGAVGAVCRVANPILLARHILEDGRHVLLVGAGAERFAAEVGMPLCRPGLLRVPRQEQHWRGRHGTVGCVARDRDGTLAAGTSTGGVFDKLPGRVGDSALIGCGTYADAAAAVSCTGDGDAIVKSVLARRVAESVARGVGAQDAAAGALADFQRLVVGEAGVIVADAGGGLGFAHNTVHMPIAWREGKAGLQARL